MDVQKMFEAAIQARIPDEELFDMMLTAASPLAEKIIDDVNKYSNPNSIVSLALLIASCALARGDGNISFKDWQATCNHIYERMSV